MANKHANLDSLFNDIADAIREKIGDESIIPAVDFPDLIRDRLQVAPPKPYLTFKSPSSFTLSVNDTTKHWDGTLEYSTDASTWTTWDGRTTLSSATKGSSNVLYLRGTGNSVITGSINYRWVLTGSDIRCIGNIENLLDYATVKAGNHPTMADYCYFYMFSGCTSLTQAPDLPATTLVHFCYNNMFSGTSLTKAPALPATTLATNCYYEMFQDCTTLTQAPALPATTLASHCYAYMFSGTAITQAPALSATTLATNCYDNMFSGTALKQAPALPATTLADYCYNDMFKGCKSLTQAPALPATTLAKNCYDGMFSGCISLTQAPALPATTLAEYCYYAMFWNCLKIKLSSTQTGEYTQEYRIPSSGTGTTGTDSYALKDMFRYTGGTFTGTPEINTTYYLSNTNEVIGGSIVVDITASNISDYFTVTNGSSYYFNGEGNVFTTNNAGVNSSAAYTILTAKQDISEISFDYSYSSEPSYDKFTLTVAGSTIENAVSGATTTKSYNGSLASGQTIEFTYAKDGSVDKNDDKCTFSNMVIKLG